MTDKPSNRDIGRAAQRAQREMVAGNPSRAVEILAPLMQYAVQMPRVLNLYGACLLNVGRHERATGFLKVACEGLPDDLEAGMNYALALRRSTNFEEALNELQRIRQVHPAAPAAAAMLANLLVDLSRRDEALQLLDEMRDHGPYPPEGEAPLLLARAVATTDASEGPALARKMLELVEVSRVPQRSRAQLSCEAGRILDREKRCDEAFAALMRAKEITATPWDPVHHAKRVDAAIALFCDGDGQRMPVADSDGTNMVFIVGMPRSGTSLLEQMLGMHADVVPMGERIELMMAAAELQLPTHGETAMVTTLAGITAARVNEIAAKMIAAYAAIHKGHGTLAIDKNPFNYLYVPLVARLLPGARVIHITRDPMDTCWSNLRQRFNDAHGHLGKLEWLGKYYLDYRRMMAAWQALPAPGQRPLMFELSYEQLVSEPEEQMRALCDFLGIELQPQMLNPEKSDRIVATASRLQVRKKLYSSSIGAWRPYAAHLAPLRKVLECEID